MEPIKVWSRSESYHRGDIHQGLLEHPVEPCVSFCISFCRTVQIKSSSQLPPVFTNLEHLFTDPNSDLLGNDLLVIGEGRGLEGKEVEVIKEHTSIHIQVDDSPGSLALCGPFARVFTSPSFPRLVPIATL